MSYPEDILRDADMAMYQAKELGKDHVEVYDKTMHDRVLQRMHMGTALRQGALQKEFHLHYQPIISLQNGCLVGFEALLRWYTPDRGILIPGDFMEAIDTAGLIYTTDQWVLENACRQAALNGKTSIRTNSYPFVSVNLSARISNIRTWSTIFRKATKRNETGTEQIVVGDHRTGQCVK